MNNQKILAEIASTENKIETLKKQIKEHRNALKEILNDDNTDYNVAECAPAKAARIAELVKELYIAQEKRMMLAYLAD